MRISDWSSDVCSSDLDPNGRTATAKSYYTVVQTIFTLPPQIIVMGRYDDRFVKENADWHIAYRDYTLIDAAGDLRGHIRGSLLDNQSVDPELCRDGWRSEERRVGKECFSTVRFWWLRSYY